MILKNNQSLLDLATQINGDVKSALDLAVHNDFSLTDDIAAGTEYEEAETVYKNEIVESFFFNKDLELTTSEPRLELGPIGIGTMIVESDFDVT